MSDEVLCCIDGTQDVRDLDLKERERLIYTSEKIVDKLLFVVVQVTREKLLGRFLQRLVGKLKSLAV